MNIEHNFFEKQPYLSVTVSDKVITAQGAISNLKLINDYCAKNNCRKVFMDALAVEKREIANHEMRRVGEQISDIRLAFYCKPELVDQSARLLSAITYSDGYVVQCFSSEDEAKNWLISLS